jgi:hypothetical protein
VPWCPTCDRFLSPPSVNPDGTCPTCGKPVDPGKAAATVPTSPDPAPDSAPGGEKPRRRIPWHLKALLGVFAIYLGYRTAQGIEWLARNL